MTRTEAKRLFALVAATYRLPPSEIEAEAWFVLLAPLDFDIAMAATKRLLTQSRDYPPKPGDVYEAAVLGDAPSIEQATAWYTAGEWDRHPLVGKAARAVYWDRASAPTKARDEFRVLYLAALHDARDAGAGNALGPVPHHGVLHSVKELESDEP